jgi:hypothetical protein
MFGPVSGFYTLDMNYRPLNATTNCIENAVFWDVTPCASCNNRRSGGTYRLHCQGEKNQRAKNVTSNFSLQRASVASYC